MRFKLLEYQDFPSGDDAIKKAEKEYFEDIKKANTADDRDVALKALIKFWANDGKISKKLLDDQYRGIRRLILDSMSVDGYSKSSNTFLRFVLKNSDSLDIKNLSKIKIIEELLSLGIINYADNQKWWSDKSLYDRADDEFEYTIKVFDIAANKDVASKYYENANDISVNDLYHNGRIKNSGLHNHDNPREKTIWNQVETWGRKYSEKNLQSNKKEKKSNKKRLYSIRDIFEENNIKSNSLNEEIDNLIEILKHEGIISAEKIRYVDGAIKSNAKYADRLLSVEKINPNEYGSVSEFIIKEFDL